MTAEFAAHLAIVVLPIICFGLLAAIGIQLDLGEPEHAPPTFTPGWTARSQRAEWAADFAAVRQQVPDWQRAERLGDDHPDWKFNTKEWDRAYLEYFGQPAEATASVLRGAR